MGLDMYLERFPRYKDYGPREILSVEEHEEWKKEGENYTFEEWCGCKEEDLPKGEDYEFFKSLISTKYYDWDDEKRYPHEGIYEHVAYWRKANAIHAWFVSNVQDGEDDCEYHREVTKEDIEELMGSCKKILEECILIPGKVKNGYSFKNGKEFPNYEDGYIVANPEICHGILPSQDGFFFGNTQYDQWYIEDIRYTYNKMCKILEETDFEKEMLFYISSW